MPSLRAQWPPPVLSWAPYPVSLALCLSVAAAVSWLIAPHVAGWYAALSKPIFSPPDWVFPLVWPAFFFLMGLSAARVAALPAPSAQRRTALVFFAAQLALNLLWSFAFFGRESPQAGMLTIVILVAALAATTMLFWRLDRPAGLMLLPCLAFVAFAALLNGSIVILN